MHCKIIFLITIFYFINVLCAKESEENEINAHRNLSIYNISDILINSINFEYSDPNIRIDELRDKLETIKKYVVDNEAVNRLLINVTRETNLTETNFYKALIEEDHFRFITENGTLKSLYLKLKEKVTRDDVMKILSDKKQSDFVKSARNAMHISGKTKKEVINEVVDKMIAEVPNDEHDYKATINDSKYWDPQNELEDLRDFHQHDGRRIYRGERTSIRYYPFMASIHLMGRFWCGGVIYWHDIVITSASCLQLIHNNRFFRENPKVLEVRIGSNQSRIGGEMVDALEVYFHPGYSPKTLRNNIAIIRIRRHLFFNYHRIPKCIAISTNEAGIPDTAEVLLLGWGVTKMSQKMSYEPIFLQRKFLPIYPNKFCKEVYGDKFITSTMFCAGTLTTGEGACDHDAGGPAVLAGKLVGIISFGPTICGYPNAPTVFTLVGAFSDWIETINQSMPSYYRGKKRTTTTTRSPLLDMLDDWPSGVPHIESLGWFTPMAEATKPHAPLDETATLAQGVVRVGFKGGEDSDEGAGWSIDEGSE